MKERAFWWNRSIQSSYKEILRTEFLCMAQSHTQDLAMKVSDRGAMPRTALIRKRHYGDARADSRTT
nr:MAG TPA: hypothetical protein [Caudoviricetes sp.]DAK90271.1 MAG TPA: hypothetical protein [Caudoviricetes sp.]